MRRELAAMALITASAAGAAPADAAENGSPPPSSQFHFRTGYLAGTVASVSYGSRLSVPSALDMEYEIGLTRTRSTFARATLAYDMSSARMPYAAIATGMRFYLLGANSRYDSRSGGDRLERTPKLRVFAGPELGIAQITIQQMGPVLGVATTSVEIGGSAGVIHQLGKGWGLEFLAAFHAGYGFANVTAASSIYRVFGGLSFYL